MSFNFSDTSREALKKHLDSIRSDQRVVREGLERNRQERESLERSHAELARRYQEICDDLEFPAHAD